MCGKVRVLIEDWAVVGVGNDPFKAPELRVQALTGCVFGHPEIEDGARVTTSRIETIDLDRRRVETGQTVYFLGAIRDDYLLSALDSAKKPETKAALLKHWYPKATACLGELVDRHRSLVPPLGASREDRQ